MPKTVETTMRVRFSDTDADGGVFHANYITFFSIGRADFYNQLGVGQRQLEEEDNIRPTVIDARCTYRAVARFDDVLTVRTGVERMGNKSVTFVGEIVRKYNERNETLIATSSIVHVYIDRSGATIPIPDKVRKAFSD